MRRCLRQVDGHIQRLSGPAHADARFGHANRATPDRLACHIDLRSGAHLQGLAGQPGQIGLSTPALAALPAACSGLDAGRRQGQIAEPARESASSTGWPSFQRSSSSSRQRQAPRAQVFRPGLLQRHPTAAWPEKPPLAVRAARSGKLQAGVVEQRGLAVEGRGRVHGPSDRTHVQVRSSPSRPADAPVASRQVTPPRDGDDATGPPARLDWRLLRWRCRGRRRRRRRRSRPPGRLSWPDASRRSQCADSGVVAPNRTTPSDRTSSSATRSDNLASKTGTIAAGVGDLTAHRSGQRQSRTVGAACCSKASDSAPSTPWPTADAPAATMAGRQMGRQVHAFTQRGVRLAGLRKTAWSLALLSNALPLSWKARRAAPHIAAGREDCSGRDGEVQLAHRVAGTHGRSSKSKDPS